MANDDKVVFTLRTDPDTYARLRLAADMKGVSKSELLERLVVQHGLDYGVGLEGPRARKRKP